MATVENSGHWRGTANPFPAAAVAHVSDLRPAMLTIKTKAVEEIGRLLDGYLGAAARAVRFAAPDRGGEELAGTGRVLVIEGDYGTGKTHLAIEILDRVEAARRVGDVNVRVFYRVAPGGNFLTLYTDLMDKVIGVTEVLNLVREFYADIVADELRGRPFTDALVRHLESDDADPQLVIERFGLKEGQLSDKLRQRLSSVTTDATFSRALILLLQPDLQQLVWKWFTGGAPGQVLSELGVTEPIRTDTQALDALGVIARLYGRNNRRLVLVIDELERLALAWDRTQDASAQAVKKLFEIFHSAGALLTVCGLSDVFSVLPKDPDRIDAIVNPSLLTSEEVRWYIEEVQERSSHQRTLEPFTEDSIDYIVYLTSGVAREVLLFCYYAYEYASETGRPITTSVVNSLARRRSSSGLTDMVRGEIEDILFEQGWTAERNRVLGGAPGLAVDFWVSTGQGGGGRAVIVTDSVLEESDVRDLAERAAAVKAADSRRSVIVVISGYIPGKLRQRLAESLTDGALLVYGIRTFSRDFILAMNTAGERLTPSPGTAAENPPVTSELIALRAETERIARQQTNALRLVQQLASSTEERLNDLLLALEAMPARLGTAPGGKSADLPAELEQLFSTAERRLAAYGDVRLFVRETFDLAAQEPGARFSLTHRLREPEALTSMGVAAFLWDLLTGFRESVRVWLGALSKDDDRESPTSDQREQLRGICQTYDALYGVTPLFKLDPLPEVTSLAGSQRETVPRAGRTARREALRDALDGLGDRVYETAVNMTSADRGDDG